MQMFNSQFLILATFEVPSLSAEDTEDHRNFPLFIYYTVLKIKADTVMPTQILI